MAKRKRSNKVFGYLLNVTPKRLKPTMKKVIKGVPGKVESGKKMVDKRFNTIIYGKNYRSKKRK